MVEITPVSFIARQDARCQQKRNYAPGESGPRWARSVGRIRTPATPAAGVQRRQRRSATQDEEQVTNPVPAAGPVRWAAALFSTPEATITGVVSGLLVANFCSLVGLLRLRYQILIKLKVKMVCPILKLISFWLLII